MDNSALVNRIRAELQKVGTAGLGEFDVEADITALDIPGLAARV